MLLRKLFFFSFYFQFNLLVSIPTGSVLALIDTLWVNPRTSSSQEKHPRSHFLFNIITLMTMCSTIKVAHVISLFINHCSMSSICTALKSSIFFHLQKLFSQVPERMIMIALLLNNGKMAVSHIFLTSGCPHQGDLPFFNFQFTDMHGKSQEKLLSC